MITVAVISVVVLVVVLCLAVGLRRQPVTVMTLADFEKYSRPVDLDSFRNLIDPDEEHFLKTNLTRSQFREVQRARMQAALEYVRCTSHNSKLLVQFADVARRSPQPEVARAAVELANSALQLRVYSVMAMFIFWLRVLIPTLPLRSSSIVTTYGRMCDRMSGLTRVQLPAQASRVEAAL